MERRLPVNDSRAVPLLEPQICPQCPEDVPSEVLKQCPRDPDERNLGHTDHAGDDDEQLLDQLVERLATLA